jgi:pimeloyl-ACP methyl ester carboxylesterase
MKKFIKNRNWDRISVLVEESEDQKWLVFVMHWLWWFKEVPMIRAFIKPFLDNNFTVVSFDTTNTIWESDWKFEDATVTNYYSDLEDVIKWASWQNFYEEKFYLVWHSLWWICTSLFTQKFPEKIKWLAPISTVVSWKFSLEIENENVLKNREESWWLIRESKSKPWFIKKLKWNHMVDRCKYDLLKNVDKMNMPVLLAVWDKDNTTPLIHQKILFEKLSWEKELHIIKNAEHSFVKEEEFIEIYNIFDKWIKKVEKLNN